MNYDNKNADKKFQELEAQLLPDLSKMDEHWKQMKQVLGPGAPVMKKKIIGKKLFYILPGLLVILGTFYFLSHNDSGQSKKHLNSETQGIKTNVPADSPRVTKITVLERTDSVSQAKITFRDKKDSNSAKELLKKQQKSNKNKLLLENFYGKLQKKSQAFLINNSKDTVIYGKEGTSLYIPANSFDVTGPVTFLLTEFYSVNDMVTNKLTTTCEGRQLASGGMIYLDARDKNDQLVDLKKGASLRLDMAVVDNRKQMELFYGYDHYRNDTTIVMDSISWSRTGRIFTPVQPPISFKVRSSRALKDARDTLRISDKDEFRRMADIQLKDTVAGKQEFLIKGDSLISRRYGVNINQLGWLNCDRFFDDPRPKIKLVVDLNDKADNYNTILVFDKIKSIMPVSSSQGNFVTFSNLPSGEAARIVSLGIKDGKPVTAMQTVNISDGTVKNLRFEEVTTTAYEKKLRQ